MRTGKLRFSHSTLRHLGDNRKKKQVSYRNKRASYEGMCQTAIEARDSCFLFTNYCLYDSKCKPVIQSRRCNICVSSRLRNAVRRADNINETTRRAGAIVKFCEKLQQRIISRGTNDNARERETRYANIR